MNYSESELVKMIINSDNFLEIIATFWKNIDILRDYTFLVFDNKMARSINKHPPADMSKKVKKVNLVSTFSENVCVINETLCREMAYTGHADFSYKYCYDLDINLMNVLVDYHQGKSPSDDTLSDLHLLSNDITCFPYMIENAAKLEDVHTEKCVVDTLLVYNKFKRSVALNSFGSEYPYVNEDYLNVKDSIDLMNRMNCDTLDHIWWQKYIYALLLKTALVSFEKGKTAQHHIQTLLSFVNNELGVVFERELFLCCLFLKNRNDTRIKKFYRGVQCSSTNLLKTIKSMAWDLFHLRFCVDFGMAYDTNENPRNFCIHYFATCDNGLANVATAYPLKYLIYKKGQLRLQTLFDQSKFDEFTDMNIVETLYKQEHVRELVRKKTNVDFLITEMEKEILQTTCRVP